MSKSESYASVWDAIADTPEQAANLRARAELMQKIAARLKQHDWTQAEAATLRRNAATDQRSAARPGLALLARRAGQHRDGAGLPRAFDLEAA
jgi:hypothetical protein